MKMKNFFQSYNNRSFSLFDQLLSFILYPAKTAKKEILLLNVYAVFVILAPFNILSYFTDEEASDWELNPEITDSNHFAENDQMNRLMTRLFDQSDEENEKPVTTADTSREPVSESEVVVADKRAQSFESWLVDLPIYEEKSPQTDFIQRLAPAAILIAQKNGIYPSVMLAQASLE